MRIFCALFSGYLGLHLVWGHLSMSRNQFFLKESIVFRIEKGREILKENSFKCEWKIDAKEKDFSEVKMFLAVLDTSEKKIEILTLNRKLIDDRWRIYSDPEIKISEMEITGPNAYIVPGYELLAVMMPLIGKSVEEIIYTPYSEEIDRWEVRREGRQYLDSVIEEAYAYLEERRVNSLSFSDKRVTKVIPKELIRNLIIVEHLPFDFSKTIEERIGMVFAILGANKEIAFDYTISKKNAVGLSQFIKPTYEAIVRLYPEAELDPDFCLGTRNHINVIATMILLCDANLSLTRYPDFEIPLVTMYNGGTGRIGRETRGYLKKYGLVKDTIG